MSQEQNIEHFVKNPSLLVELCQEVFNKLISADDNQEIIEMEAQLLQISKAVSALEKQNVPVPDALRAEKTRLAAALGIKTEASQAVKYLVDGLEEILKNNKYLSSRENNIIKCGNTYNKWSRRKKKDQTSYTTFKPYLLESLRELGGSAHCNDVIDLMEKKLRGKLLPGDLVYDETHSMIKWKYTVHWTRQNFIKEGILKKDSPKGIWELVDIIQ